ncbi:MAG TPA: type II toxin-antitoxin system RelE/ParE family toxin [Gemmatimonadales bacterium]
MTPRLSIRRAARQEIEEAFRWYEERSSGLGYEFLRAVRATLAHIARDPELYPIAIDDIRKAPLHRFPYVAYYVVLPRGISVLAVMHGRRHPRRWQSRR